VAVILVKNSEKKLNYAGASRTRTNCNVSQIQKFAQEVKNLEGLSKRTKKQSVVSDIRTVESPGMSSKNPRKLPATLMVLWLFKTPRIIS